MKSFNKKMDEGRCQGYGKDYVPFFLVREFKSRGTATAIWDPFEERAVQCLSQAEVNVYTTIRWQTNVKHIREQFLLDTKRMNAIAETLGIRKAPYWTTDFLVDYDDGSMTAFSVKADDNILDPENRIYRGNESKLHRLLKRQEAEKIYWESQGVRFRFVTNRDINRVLVANVKAVMSYYDELKVVNTTQKLKYLIAHRYVAVPMDKKILNFKELTERACFDVDELYKEVTTARELYERHTEGRNGK